MKVSDSTVLVTGATGFLGGATIVNMLASGFEGRIVALVRGETEAHCTQRLINSLNRFEPTWGNQLPANLQLLRGELTDAEWPGDPKLDGLTHVLHVAANTSFGKSLDIRKTNVDGALAVARAASRHDLVRYVHVGTAHIAGLEGPPLVHENLHPDRDVSHLVPYTAAKAEAEVELLATANHLPLVIARPSIVAGHTRLGCKPSGSIFWVCRAVDRLRMITWDPENRIDVIPVDYAATALAHLLFAPKLKYQRYHISAGTGRSISWREIGHEFARIAGGSREDRYHQVDFSEISRAQLQKAFGEKHYRPLRKALELYYKFCGAGRIFDNRRLLGEGIAGPPAVASYLEPCLVSSHASIYDQMLGDF